MYWKLTINCLAFILNKATNEHPRYFFFSGWQVLGNTDLWIATRHMLMEYNRLTPESMHISFMHKRIPTALINSKVKKNTQTQSYRHHLFCKAIMKWHFLERTVSERNLNTSFAYWKCSHVNKKASLMFSCDIAHKSFDNVLHKCFVLVLPEVWRLNETGAN